jgi:ribonuclease P protein component
LKRPFSFPKSERLHGKKAVDSLFSSEIAWLVYPFRIVIEARESASDAVQAIPRILFSVSKKNFRKAHDRNRIKRQMREAYRLQKPEFLSLLSESSSKSLPKDLTIGLIYIAKTGEAYSFIRDKTKRALHEIASKVCKSEE